MPRLLDEVSELLHENCQHHLFLLVSTGIKRGQKRELIIQSPKQYFSGQTYYFTGIIA
jgi:hypothetical protein